MKKGYCLECEKRSGCVDVDECLWMTRELNRITEGRKKPLKVIYEHEMPENMRRWWNNTVYGAYDGDE